MRFINGFDHQPGGIREQGIEKLLGWIALGNIGRGEYEHAPGPVRYIPQDHAVLHPVGEVQKVCDCKPAKIDKGLDPVPGLQLTRRNDACGDSAGIRRPDQNPAAGQRPLKIHVHFRKHHTLVGRTGTHSVAIPGREMRIIQQIELHAPGLTGTEQHIHFMPPARAEKVRVRPGFRTQGMTAGVQDLLNTALEGFVVFTVKPEEREQMISHSKQSLLKVFPEKAPCRPCCRVPELMGYSPSAAAQAAL